MFNNLMKKITKEKLVEKTKLLKGEVLENIEKNKKKFLITSLSVFMVLCITVCAVFSNGINALVSRENDEIYQSEITYQVDEDIVYEIVKDDFDHSGVEAFGVYIDDEFFAAVENADQLDFLLNGMVILKKNNLRAESSLIQEKIFYVSGKYNKEDIIDYKDFKSLILAQQDDVVSYKVKTKDTLDSVSQIFNVPGEEILALNSLTAPEEVKPGTVLKIKLKESVINIKSVSTQDYDVEVPYSVTQQPNDDMYVGEENYIVKGENGIINHIDKVEFVNDTEVVREKISETVKKEVVNEVVEVGTKEAGVPTNSFVWPVPAISNITSGFGPRWGTIHQGIDIANGSYGSTIVASDGGVVTCASNTNNGYGIHVIIDHGNGYQTLYGHASQVFVSVGEQVAQGEPIAAIGNTGNSTGPHLHFEIIENFVKVNPLGYL